MMTAEGRRRPRAGNLTRFAVTAFAVGSVLAAQPGYAQSAPDRGRDRGDGVALSMFGTYLRSGEVLVYPFFEYYRDSNYEYEAGELGFEGTTELRGRYRANEGLILLAYGISENLAVEFEAAAISAVLEKSPLDTSAMPARLEQSGLGDVEAQLRWRWKKETDSRPEFFSYAETVFPFQRSKLLIGTSEWEFKVGTGMVRGLRWGTMTLRAEIANVGGSFEPGEYAVEYLRRLSRRWRVFAAIEGSEDEVELIGEAQVFLTPSVVLKLNSGFGITSKATDWAPEIGVIFTFR
jgi:hypothetical protein